MMVYKDGPTGIRQVLYLTGLALVAGYQTINVFVPNADMIVATRILATGFYAAVVFAYAGDAWDAVRAPEPEKSDWLIVGIWLSFLSHLCQSIYAIIYRLADAPMWLLNAEVVPFIVGLSMVAAMLHILATGGVKEGVPRRSQVTLGLATGLAVIVVGGVIATRPDIAPVIERARPYIGDWWKTGFVPGGIPAGPPPA